MGVGLVQQRIMKSWRVLSQRLHPKRLSSCLKNEVNQERPHIDFSDAREAFKSKSTLELVKSYSIYTLFKYDVFVENSFKIMKLAQKLLGPSLFRSLMKATLYGQFAAGENNEDIKKAFSKFRSVGVRCVLNYSAEEDESGSTSGSNRERQKLSKSIYDNSTEVLVDSIKLTGDMSENNDGMIAIKLTGLCPTPLLSKLSRSIVSGEKIFKLLAGNSSISDGIVSKDSFIGGMDKMGIVSKSSDLWEELSLEQTKSLGIVSWKQQFVPHTNLYKTISETNKWNEFLPSFSDEELMELDKALTRIDTLGQCSADHNVKLLVDAEQTYYQPAIRYFAVNYLMAKYNKAKAVVYNTQQCYLKKTHDSILFDLHMANAGGFHYGVKIVRGAYMEQERAIAAEKGYDSLVWSSKSETNSNYYKILELMLNRVKNTPHDSIVVASHNEDTIHLAMDKMHELNLSKTNGRVVFGQVMGMADHLALAISSAGYMAYKFMPYGPVEEVLPYLSRRANENRGMLIGPVRERRVLANEIKRRMSEA